MQATMSGCTQRYLLHIPIAFGPSTVPIQGGTRAQTLEQDLEL